jgi:Phospholipase_D-nuclease N-terminal
MMTFIWIVSACVLAVVWVLTIVDIFRRHYSTGATVGWIVLIILLPFIGAIIYWIVRKPTAEEVEQAYRAESDFRRGSSPRP